MDDRRSPLRLLILSHLYPRSTNPSWGIFVDYWVQAVRRLVRELEVVAPVVWVPPGLARIPKYHAYGAPRVEYHHGRKVYKPRFVRPPGGWFRLLEGRSVAWGARRLLRQLHQQHRFDLLLAINLFPDAHAAVLLKRQLGNIPVATMCIGSDVQITLRGSRWHRRLGRMICKRSDVVIGLSEELTAEIIELGVDPQKVHTLYIGIDLAPLDQIGSVDHAARQRPEILPGKVIAFLGRLIVDKGIYDLLEAFAQLDGELRQQASLLYIAGGAEKDALLRKAREYGLGRRVIVTDRLPHSEALRLLKGSDLMVLPTYAEGTPNSVLEAFALRVPVITTSVGGIGEFGRSGEYCDLFEPRDVGSLARLLRRHMQAEPDVERTDRAERLVREKLDLKDCARRLVSILESAVRQQAVGISPTGG